MYYLASKLSNVICYKRIQVIPRRFYEEVLRCRLIWTTPRFGILAYLGIDLLKE